MSIAAADEIYQGCLTTDYDGSNGCRTRHANRHGITLRVRRVAEAIHPDPRVVEGGRMFISNTP